LHNVIYVGDGSARFPAPQVNYSMPKLVVQLQPHREPHLDLAAVTRLFSDGALMADAELQVSQGLDDVPYVNYDFVASDVQRLWRVLQNQVMEDSTVSGALSKAAVVVCEGEQGWNDYLLLHHYDRREALDDPPER
jgi:hypothetical protein